MTTGRPVRLSSSRRILRGEISLSGPVANAIRYHAMRVEIGDASPIEAARLGRPPKSAPRP